MKYLIQIMMTVSKALNNRKIVACQPIHSILANHINSSWQDSAYCIVEVPKRPHEKQVLILSTVVPYYIFESH